jgi:hypothetical protein
MGHRLHRRNRLLPRLRGLQVHEARLLPPPRRQEGQGELRAGRRRGARLPALHDRVQHGQRAREGLGEGVNERRISCFVFSFTSLTNFQLFTNPRRRERASMRATLLYLRIRCSGGDRSHFLFPIVLVGCYLSACFLREL